MASQDFTRIGSWGPERPDFSSNGAPIEFGYWTAGQASPSGYATLSWGIDNFKATVYPTQPAGPFTGTATVSVTAYDWLTGAGVPAGRSAEQRFDVHVGTGAICGTKYDDCNGNGQRDPAEPGVEGWVFFIDQNNNDQWDSGEPLAVTDYYGQYSFAGLVAGTYTVREMAQGAWTARGVEERVVTLGAGQIATGVDFGNFRVVDAGVDDRRWEGKEVKIEGTIRYPDPSNGSNLTAFWEAKDASGRVVYTSPSRPFTLYAEHV